MDFYLVRHGEAVSEAVNPQRPLSEIGRRAVENVARSAAEKGIRVSEIRHSGILRAQQTAEILARHLLPENGIRASQGWKPGDDPMLAKAELETAQTSTMLVGHLPHLGKLVALLTTGDPEREAAQFSPATMVCCFRDGLLWTVRWTLAPEPE